MRSRPGERGVRKPSVVVVDTEIPQPLLTHKGAVDGQPVERLIEDPRVAPSDLEREQEKRFRIGRPGLSNPGVASTPICAHSFQTKSSSRFSTRALSSEIGILDPQVRERSGQFVAEALRWVVRDRPACRRQQLLRRRLERSQVEVVLRSGRLIGESVELEIGPYSRDWSRSTNPSGRPKSSKLAGAALSQFSASPRSPATRSRASRRC